MFCIVTIFQPYISAYVKGSLCKNDKEQKENFQLTNAFFKLLSDAGISKWTLHFW
jgi:hypothetical protein